MMISSRLWLIPLALLALAAVSMAYLSGGPPSLVGHTSDEIAFNLVRVDRSCNGAGPVCTVTCPVDTATEKYTIVTGSCSSQDALRWRIFGEVLPFTNGWRCADDSHQSGHLIRASAICLKGGP